MIPTSSVSLDGREDVLKFISSIILFRRRNSAELKAAKRRQRVKVCEATHVNCIVACIFMTHVFWKCDAHGRTHGFTYNPNPNLSISLSLSHTPHTGGQGGEASEAQS